VGRWLEAIRSFLGASRSCAAPPELDLALVVGAQRSGTTWLQQLLGAHPRIVTGAESHLFSQYLFYPWSHWHTQEQMHKSGGRLVGLSCYVTLEEFEAILRSIAVQVLGRLLEGKPSARTIVEKTPDHALRLNFARTLFPKAKIIHILRDPRDVVASLLAAKAKAWGRTWAPADAQEAARRWVEYVSGARGARQPEDLYAEVRYEDLLADAPREMGRLLAFLGAPADRDAVRDICARFSFEACQEGTSPNVLVYCGQHSAPPPAEPEGFYRSGQAGGWQQTLSAEDLTAIDEIAGPLMREVGYASSPSLVLAQ
jgi:hypothetical protein